MARPELPEIDGEHSRAWWRAIAIDRLQQNRKTSTAKIASQIRHRRQLAAEQATCESESTPSDHPAGGTKP